MTSNDGLFLEGVRIDFCDKHTTIRDLLVTLLIDRDNEERVCATFDQSELTIGQLSDSAHRVAASLLPYNLVAICMKPSFELIVTLCGVVLRGIPYVPLEPSLPLERLKYILEDSQAQLAIVENVSLLENIIKTVTCSQLCIDVTPPEVNKTTEVNREDTFCLMYTSGSTGKPKGVQLPHRALINRLHWQWSYFPFNEEDVCCMKTSISFLDSVVEIFAPLIHRVPVVIIPKLILVDIDRLISVLSTRRISYIVLVPSLLTFLLNHLENNNSSLSALRLIASSGETLSQTLIESFFTLKQCFSPTCRLINLYGSTEVMADVTCEVYEVIDHFHEMSLDGRTSIGYPIANMRVDIIEPDQQGIGELVVTGEGVANGYHNVDTTNITLSNKFFSSNDGRLGFRTGDLGKIWNHRIIFYGRHDNQVR
jgi:non-ribosomal peptide synthetase component F